MDYLYADNMLIVDLESGELSEEPLPEDFISRYLGGARANLALYEEYKEEDPLIFGSGIFTATPVPAACLGVVTGKSPLTGKVGHSPLTLYAGMELKLSGFDFIVIKGKSPKPVYLWIHDGLADLLDAEEMWNADCWKLTDDLRSHIGEDLVQVLGIGAAGTNGCPAAGININYWSGGDRFGFGAVMGEKKVKALAMRGLGMLDAAEPAEFNGECLKLHKQIRENGNHFGEGFAALAPLLGGEDISGWLSGLLHRHSACFACPLQCNTFVKYNEAPSEMHSTEIQEPGMLLTGLSPLIKLKEGGFSAEDAARTLELCARLGLDPDAAADMLISKAVSDAGKAAEVLRDFNLFRDNGVSGWSLNGAEEVNGQSVFSPWAPFKVLEGKDRGDWQELNALAYTFGICPVFMLTMPELNNEVLTELLKPAAELTPDAETVKNKVKELLQ